MKTGCALGVLLGTISTLLTCNNPPPGAQTLGSPANTAGQTNLTGATATIVKISSTDPNGQALQQSFTAYLANPGNTDLANAVKAQLSKQTAIATAVQWDLANIQTVASLSPDISKAWMAQYNDPALSSGSDPNATAIFVRGTSPILALLITLSSSVPSDPSPTVLIKNFTGATP